VEGAAASSNDRNPHVLLSTAELIRFRDDRKTLQFTMTSGPIIEGAIRWFDAEVIHIVTEDRNELTLLKHAILFYGAKP
jgi:sRNA-binding regulator protein Hfq